MSNRLAANASVDEYLQGGRPWQRALLLDVGSTFTKALAIGSDGTVLGRAQSPTTIDNDVMDGAAAAARALPEIARGPYDWALSSSSAAGGLRMTSVGLTASLSGKAGGLAALGAGGKVVSSEHGLLDDAALARIEAATPHLVLLAGGIDGGNAQALLHNASVLCGLSASLGFIVAGNALAAPEAARLLTEKGRDVLIADNVFPRPGEISIEPTREAVREMFMRHITRAKGLEGLMAALHTDCEPTPLAVSRALSVVERPGNPVVFVDLGGATTDVHSIGGQKIERRSAEIPAPEVMRTVEGDLGMRWGAPGTVAAMSESLRIATERALDCDLEREAERRQRDPEFLPATEADRDIDRDLAAAAVTIAVERHAGRVVVRHRPWGDRYQVVGKDLRRCDLFIVTGGVFRHLAGPDDTVRRALADIDGVQAPENPRIVIDRNYALYATGLLARHSTELAEAVAEDALSA